MLHNAAFYEQRGYSMDFKFIPGCPCPICKPELYMVATPKERGISMNPYEAMESDLRKAFERDSRGPFGISLRYEPPSALSRPTPLTDAQKALQSNVSSMVQDGHDTYAIKAAADAVQAKRAKVQSLLTQIAEASHALSNARPFVVAFQDADQTAAPETVQGVEFGNGDITIIGKAAPGWMKRSENRKDLEKVAQSRGHLIALSYVPAKQA